MTFLEYPYLLGYTVKKRCALRNRKKLPCPVISIGNLTLGGTGKTPAVMALAQRAAVRGFYPCILTRGYRGKARGPCFVSRGEGAVLDPMQAGDEAVLMAEALPGIPIIKGSDRYRAGIFALEDLKRRSPDSISEGRWFFILDDGFQHWALHRDKDVLLINGMNPFGNGKLFPFGPLREPLSAMKRADLIVITNTAEPCDDGSMSESETGKSDIGTALTRLQREIRQYAANVPVYCAQHVPRFFLTLSGEAINLSEMRDKRVFAFCGIGNPLSFKSALRPLIGELTGFIIFRDHHQYGRADVRQIAEHGKKTGADWIVTTEKDIMRLKRLPLPDRLLALRIEFRVDDGFYEEVFDFRRRAWSNISM